jgi:uncharacterized protein (DUF433 family)
MFGTMVGFLEQGAKMNAVTAAKPQNPRDIPTYTISEASHYLLIPLATLRSWTVGRYYPVQDGKRLFSPVIAVTQKHPAMLSFVNLIEAHVLDAIRRVYGVRLPEVRKAIAFLRSEFKSDHPLIEQKIETDGKDLFIRSFGQLIAASKGGQLAMPDLIDAYLRRIEWDEQGLASRLYPFTRKRQLDEPRVVVIDPRISFGRPVLVGTGVRTAIVAERYKAGESIEELAEDYGRFRLDIEEAIRCELAVEAA